MTELKKKLCGPDFVVDGNNLYVDQVLVWFNEFPVFFVCVDDNDGYYLAMMLGRDDESYGYTYYFVESSVNEIQQMMLKQIPIRDTFLNKNHFWRIVGGITVAEDVVEKLPVEEMDQEYLPAPEKYFETTSLDDKNYLKKLAKLLGKESENKEEQ